jgi:hypothetical protein
VVEVVLGEGGRVGGDGRGSPGVGVKGGHWRLGARAGEREGGHDV